MSNKDSVLLVVTSDLVANPTAIAELQKEFAEYDVHQQLSERLVERVVNLPHDKYSRVHISKGAPTGLVLDDLYDASNSGGTLTGEIQPDMQAHLVIAGFVKDDKNSGVWRKTPTQITSTAPVKLRRPQNTADLTSTAVNNPFKRAASSTSPLTPPNETEGDDEFIDEDDLIADGNVAPAYNFPAKCDPGPGRKRRRACRDCTCGLKEAEEAEEELTRQTQSAVLFNKDDIAEIDFTVPGKAVGGCGSCALGDAFRCDGCPYSGLPPFKPGEVVSVDQFGDDF